MTGIYRNKIHRSKHLLWVIIHFVEVLKSLSLIQAHAEVFEFSNCQVFEKNQKRNMITVKGKKNKSMLMQLLVIVFQMFNKRSTINY